MTTLVETTHPVARRRRLPSGWSLRRRVVLASALALVVLLGAGVAGFAVALERILLASAQESAVAQARGLAQTLDETDEGTAEALASADPGGSVVQLLGSGGAVLLSLGRPADDGPMTRRTDVPPGVVVEDRVGGFGPEQDAYALAITGLQDTRGGAFWLVVAVPLDVESATVTRAVVVLAAGAVALLAVLVVGVDRTVVRALRPVTRITAQVRDITQARSTARVSVPSTADEIAELAETMNAMLDRLARSDAASRQFVADASHELRSPLATLGVQVETAAAGAVPLDVPLVRSEILRMQRLVEDLLTLARADDRGLVVAPREVDLDDVVESEARRLAQVWHGPSRVHLAPASVLGDPDRLAQGVRNLVENACRHSTGAVAVLMEVGRREVLVHVDNDGEPVPAAQRDRIFERFVRLDEARDRDAGGSGLGLAITAAIAAAHGGALGTSTAPQGGCRFTLALPLLDLTAPATARGRE